MNRLSYAEFPTLRIFWLHLPGVFSCVPLFSAFPIHGRAIGLIRFWFNSSGKKSSWMVLCISYCISWSGHCTSGDVSVDQRAVSLPHLIRSYPFILHPTVLAPTGDCCLDPLFVMKDNVSLLNWPQPRAMIPDSLEFSQVYGYLWVGLGLERDKKTTEENWNRRRPLWLMIYSFPIVNHSMLYRGPSSSSVLS